MRGDTALDHVVGVDIAQEKGGYLGYSKNEWWYYLSPQEQTKNFSIKIDQSKGFLLTQFQKT